MKLKYHNTLLLEFIYFFKVWNNKLLCQLSKDRSYGSYSKLLQVPQRKRHTHRHTRKCRSSKTNAYRLSAFVSAPPSLAVTTLNDTHQGWGFNGVEEACVFVCVCVCVILVKDNKYKIAHQKSQWLSVASGGTSELALIIYNNRHFHR